LPFCERRRGAAREPGNEGGGDEGISERREHQTWPK
jgi:hypothetical protein